MMTKKYYHNIRQAVTFDGAPCWPLQSKILCTPLQRTPVNIGHGNARHWRLRTITRNNRQKNANKQNRNIKTKTARRTRWSS